MVTPWSLLTPGSAAFALACWSMLTGFVLGAVLMTCVFWRRLTRPGTERWLRVRLDDAMAQVGHLHALNDKLARQVVERPREEWRVTGRGGKGAA